ncbi:hypothetical protein ACFWNJ_43065, partial [Streptomyces sp. NPDC058398]
MTHDWHRMPIRRVGVALLATTLATTGIIYTGLRLDGDARQDNSSRDHRAAMVTEAAALTRAARTGHNVEVTAARTSHSTTWARADGSMAKRLYSSPVRAKVDGVWKKIDPSLHRTKDGWEPAATNTRMVFSAGSAAPGKQRASRSVTRRI